MVAWKQVPTKRVAHGHSGHYKVICRECEWVISQCRCPALDKRTQFDICFKCLRKKTLEERDLPE